MYEFEVAPEPIETSIASTDGEVGARRVDVPGNLGRRLLGTERARRARGHALAAGGADRGRHEAVPGDADLHRVTAAQHGDRADLLDVVTGGRAAAAQDAG